MNVLRRPTPLIEKDQFGFFHDFDKTLVAGEWTSVLTDSGSAATLTSGSNRGGVLALIPSDGTVADNDEAYVLSTAKHFLFAADKPAYCEARLQFTEANTDDANVCFGFSSTGSANTILDDGAGVSANFSGALIYKVDGGTVWRVRTSNGTTQTDSVSTASAGGSSYQTLGIHVQEADSTRCQVTFTVDGTPLVDATTLKPIRHLVAYASLAVMGVVAGVKNGGSNLETLNIDYIAAAQVR